MLVECGFKVCTGESDLFTVIFQSGECLLRSIFLVESIYIGLFAGDDCTCRKERLGCTDSGVELYTYVSGGVVDYGNTIQERTGDGLTRFGFDVSDATFVNFLTVTTNDVVEVVFIEIGKGKVVSYLYNEGYTIEIEELDILVHFPHLFSLRLDATVGIHHAVDTEVTIGRSAVFTVIAAVLPIFAAVGGFGSKSLVYPVPDAPPLQDGILLDDVPIFLKVTETVSHGMGVFTENKRASHFGILSIFFDVLGTVVHGTINVCVPFQ